MRRRWLSVRAKRPPVQPKPAAAVDAKAHGSEKNAKPVNSMRHFQAFASMDDYVNVTMIRYKSDPSTLDGSEPTEKEGSTTAERLKQP